MNKGQLIDKIAESADLSKADAGRALDAMIETITETLTQKEEVSLIGFGKFSTKERAARTGRNPQTGAEIQIEAATVASFKSGKSLKDAINL